MKIIFALLFSMILFLTFGANAQTAESDKIQKTNKTLVSVPVTVNDRDGHYISGLKKKDFTVYQDGAKQNIAFFATEDEPVNVVLLLDTSGSTRNSLENIKDAAKDFINLLNPNDKCEMVTFDSQIKILNPFASNRQTLINSLEKVETAAREGTVLYQAVAQTALNSFANIEGRKAIVLLSDGKDSGSSVTKDALLNQLEESEVLIYTVFYKTGVGFNKMVVDANGALKQKKESKKPRQKPQKRKKGYRIVIPEQQHVPTEQEIELRERDANIEGIDSLRKMSDATAGRFYLSDTPKLGQVFKKIAGELREQYRLGYYSKDEAHDTNAHEINVKVDRADVVVRTRGKFRAKRLE